MNCSVNCFSELLLPVQPLACSFGIGAAFWKLADKAFGQLLPDQAVSLELAGKLLELDCLCCKLFEHDFFYSIGKTSEKWDPSYLIFQ